MLFLLLIFSSSSVYLITNFSYEESNMMLYFLILSKLISLYAVIVLNLTPHEPTFFSKSKSNFT